MRFLDLVVQEYIKMVEVLAIDNAVENERIIIDKEIFKSFLEKYGYMKFNQKCKVYKDLNFIIHDKNNYTLPCKDPVLNKTVRKVVINYNAYKTIKALYNTAVK